MRTVRNPSVPREQWLDARKQLLLKEKELTRLRDELSAERRQLPWVHVDKAYRFDAPTGNRSLADLFEGRSQLVVYHFMFAPEWEAGCKSCSFWADNFERNVVHLAHRDVSLVAVSRAPLAKLTAYAKRFGWTFTWVSSGDGDFNYDFGVSFKPEALTHGEADYNYAKRPVSISDLPGVSVFFRDEDGEVFHTYSAYARGLDRLNTAYHYLDIVPRGRDEEDGNMSWLRRRDEYTP